MNRALGLFLCMENVHKVSSDLCSLEMKVGVVLQCFFNYKQESGSVQCRPVPSLMYAATFSLETCNLDLILASEIWPPMLKDHVLT